MTTKFIHLRNHETVIPERTGEPEIALTAWGGVSIGYQESETEGENHVLFTFAQCNTTDNFCRNTGRTICENRLRNGLHKKTDILKTPSGLPKGELQKILIEKYYEVEEQYWPDVREYVY